MFSPMVVSAPILISGAGLGGLLLARSLRSHNIPFRLYERDANIHARAQGYRIRISKDGLDALKEVLSEEQFNHFLSGTSATGGGGVHSLDAISGQEQQTGSNSLLKPNTDGRRGPGIGGDVLGVARGWLRQCLSEGMEDVVHFGKKSTSYTLTPSGVRIDFADGSSSLEGALLIAADGPHSAITEQLTNGKVRAYDTGARMIHGQTPAKAFDQLGVGVWSIQDHTHPKGTVGIITNVRPGQTGNEELGWVLIGAPGTFTAPDDNFSVVGKAASDLSRTLTAEWHEKFRPIFDQQNAAEAAFLKMSTAHPDGVPEWRSEPRVTLLGDAVHCMTPAGGVGANTALKDAALLGRLLKGAGGWSSEITRSYESEMRVYASENVKLSYETAARLFSISRLI